jgi:hypothetical protein
MAKPTFPVGSGRTENVLRSSGGEEHKADGGGRDGGVHGAFPLLVSRTKKKDRPGGPGRSWEKLWQIRLARNSFPRASSHGTSGSGGYSHGGGTQRADGYIEEEVGHGANKRVGANKKAREPGRVRALKGGLPGA